MENKPFLMSLDLSQVESRIVYMLTRDPKLVEQAQSKPWEHDMHTDNARMIFGMEEPGQRITKEQRFLGKKAVHGAQRDVSGKRLSDELLKEGYVRTPDECDDMIETYHRSKPAIRGVYFKECRDKLWDTRRLTNSWGRTISWPYERFDETFWKEVYSWMPQSEAAELLNQWGVVPAYNFLKETGFKSKLIAQQHDELLFNTYINEAYEIADYVGLSLQRARNYPAGELRIPCTTSIGLSWDMTTEWKKFPTQVKFENSVRELFDAMP